MAKRICAAVLAVAMLVTMLTAGISIVRASAEGEVVFTVGTVTGAKGDVVEIPVSVTEGSGIVNMDMFLAFDPAQLAIVTSQYEDPYDPDVTAGYQVNTALIKGGWMYMANDKRDDGIFHWAGATGGSGLTAGGEILRVALEILTDDVKNIAVTLTLDPCVASDGVNDIDVAHTVVNGGVTVESYLLGDVNGDKTVNMLDLMLLYRMFSKGETMTDYQKVVGDYNLDGTINMLDVMSLYKAISTGS